MRAFVFLLAIMLLATAVANAQADEYMRQVWNGTAKEVISGLDVGDVNGDGNREVAVSGSSDGLVYLFDSKGSLLWSRDVRSYINNVLVADIDGDGKDEIITGHADMYAFDYQGNEKFRWNTPSEVYAMKAADLNGDGAEDVVFATYSKSDCKDAEIMALDAKNRRKLWEYSVGKDLPFAIEIADLKGDGKKEVIIGIVYRSKSSNKATGCEKLIDKPSQVRAIGSDGQLLWSFDTMGGVISLAVGDTLGDGGKEIAVGSTALYLIDSDGRQLWQNANIITSYADSVAIGDLFGDNKSEVIAASNEVYALDGTGKLLWSGLTDSRTYKVLVADVSNDGSPEVVAGSGSLYIFDNRGTQLWKSPSHTTFGLLKTVDLTRSGYENVIAGSVKSVFAFQALPISRKVYADRLYDQALIDASTDPQKAIDELEKARGIYSGLRLNQEVVNCINQIDSLTKSAQRIGDLKTEGDAALNMSRSLFAAGDYVNASRYAYYAIDKYQTPQLNDREGIHDAQAIIDSSKATVAYNASQELSAAKESYDLRDYEGAFEHAGNARQYYMFIGDDDMADRAANLTDELQGLIEKPTNVSKTEKIDLNAIKEKAMQINPVFLLLFLLLAAAAAIMAVLAVFFWRMTSRKRLRADKLHKVTYGRQPPREYGPQPETPARKDYSKELRETLQEGRRQAVPAVAAETPPQIAFKRKHTTVEKYVTVTGAQKDGISRTGYVESAVKRRPTDVGDYARADSHRMGQASIRADEGGTSYTRTHTVPAAHEVKVELAPNKGIFRTSKCRSGVCIRTARVKTYR